MGGRNVAGGPVDLGRLDCFHHPITRTLCAARPSGRGQGRRCLAQGDEGLKHYGYGFGQLFDCLVVFPLRRVVAAEEFARQTA